MKKFENKSLYMEYALSSLVKRIESAKRKRVGTCFKDLKKFSRFTDFEMNSKKIFYKIGFATLLVLGQKMNYRSIDLGFKKIVDEGKRGVKDFR